MTEPIPDTLGDYLTERDLAALPFGRDARIGLGVWTGDAVQMFVSLKTAEQRVLVLRAAHWTVHARASVPELSRALLAFIAQEMWCPR